MKFTVALILTALLAFIFGLYFAWWSIAIASFLAAIMVYQPAGKAFLAGFLAVFLVWAGLAWWINSANNSILSSRIGELLGVGANPGLLIFITGLIGGLVAGLVAMTGTYFRGKEK